VFRTFDRYLTIQVTRRLFGVIGIFTGVFFGFALARYLSRAAADYIKADFVAELVAMKTAVATEVIIPISLFVAVLFGIESMRRREETTAMVALGVGPLQAIRGLLPLFLIAATIVAGLSLYGRPEVYQRYYRVSRQAEAAFDILDLEPQRFYVGGEGERVVMVDASGENGAMRGVFIWSQEPNGEEVIVRTGELRPAGDPIGGMPYVEAIDLRAWRIQETGAALVAASDSVNASVEFGKIAPVGYKRKAATTAYLSQSDDLDDRAEFQWRISRPLSTFLLAILAVFVAGWSRPPGRPTRTIVVGLTVCLVYNLIELTARNWVRKGTVDPDIGMWWVHGSLAIILVLLALRRGGPRLRRGERGTS
jgi:lipopolysaccharide export system permease protein